EVYSNRNPISIKTYLFSAYSIFMARDLFDVFHSLQLLTKLDHSRFLCRNSSGVYLSSIVLMRYFAEKLVV
ncbi:MAG: hypothetical protein AB8A45_01000, partial [Prochlorococcus sp.]